MAVPGFSWDSPGFYGWVQPVIHQPVYSLLERWVERELLPVTALHGMGTIAFCPLAQGVVNGQVPRRDSR